MVFEPLRVVGKFADHVHFDRIIEIHGGFPRTLHAASIHVDLDESIDRIHGAVFVGHPSDVETIPIDRIARSVVVNQKRQVLELVLELQTGSLLRDVLRRFRFRLRTCLLECGCLAHFGRRFQRVCRLPIFRLVSSVGIFPQSRRDLSS